jgi:hypothetical protein
VTLAGGSAVPKQIGADFSMSGYAACEGLAPLLEPIVHDATLLRSSGGLLGGKFVVSRIGEAYDLLAGVLNRIFRFGTSLLYQQENHE